MVNYSPFLLRIIPFNRKGVIMITKDIGVSKVKVEKVGGGWSGM